MSNNEHSKRIRSGVTRPIDPLGRVVIPKEMRRSLHLQPDDLLEIHIENGHFVMAPCRLQCVFCGSKEETALREHNGLLVCESCIKDLPHAEKAFVDREQPAS